MKYILVAVLAFALYCVLGSWFPMVNKTALVVTLLGSFGAFTYKGLACAGIFSTLCRYVA